MRVVITAAARADLVAIGSFIRLHNLERAIIFVDELLDRCLALADMPRAFPLVPRYEQFNIRRCVYRDYLIFYRVRGSLIEIVHILHGAQDYETLLFPSP
ncbi:type II toxin-antitoxin system RelE/ParE family toxin [Gloeobacter violaceus]|uniref:Gsl0167 protein n=1 Tax=Gloeobacter violaceus (strain ATCC 29082 / PCC 7421) TaxID=251221 RepID=Q7NP90_GLOVI|nr:type II toxin-antitoxin system RelE/ParE family toxin [Gloeobacter violaceus]BAC88108.1 gsl0167 [Gloeobacter violaceus PCC 7421]